jgi:peptide/nickel transport system substrate-binding protein
MFNSNSLVSHHANALMKPHRARRTTLRHSLHQGLRALAAGALLCTALGAANAAGTLRIAMTASDIPLPNGQTDQGAEGMRFMGYSVFEALVAYDLSSADKPSSLIPGLATEWKVDGADKLRWVFKLQPGVKFHDGSAFNAQAVVWNLDKILNAKAEQFDTKQAAQGRGRIPTVASYKALNDLTVEITTSEVNALLPFQMAWIVMSSPAQWQAVGKKLGCLSEVPVWHRAVQAGDLCAARACGAGAQRRLLEQVARAQARQNGAAAGARRLCSRRCPALGPGGLDRSAPADAMDSLKGAGFALVSNVYPHVWPWHFSRSKVHPGTTSGCARRPTWRSTARA